MHKKNMEFSIDSLLNDLYNYKLRRFFKLLIKNLIFLLEK